MKTSRFPIEARRGLGLVCLCLITMGFFSCVHRNAETLRDPFLSEGPELPVPAEPVAKDDSATRSDSDRSAAGIPLPLHAEEASVVANHMQVRQVQNDQAADPRNPQPAANADPAAHPLAGPIEQAGEWHPPQFAMPPAHCPPGFNPQGMGTFGPAAAGAPPVVPRWIGGAAIPPKPEDFPDEYLCDGGDRGYPVRYGYNMRLGLETEDAIAEYTDHTGEAHVKPTNKVCVYAPRFGAARSISSPNADSSVDRLASADEFARGAGLGNRYAPGIHKQHLMPGRYRTRERASDVNAKLRSAAIDQDQTLASHVKLINTFEDFQFVRSGVLTQTEEVRLAQGVQAAAVWSRNQFPVIAAQTEQAQEIEGVFRAQEFVGQEDKRGPGRLRIVKMADKDVAQPGDTITFTIRYDNLGERELYEIRIIDNLTPRLQYIEDSETSDRAGELLLQDNEEGSVILEFVLDDPLPAGEGGVVTFEAQVQ